MKKWTMLFAVLVLAGPAGAAAMDKEELRRLAKMPEPDGFTLGIGFSASKGFLFAGENTDPPSVEIARIRKELKGDASDAARYLRLGRLYARMKCAKEEADAKGRGLALFRQEVKEHPQDMYRLAQLGDALYFTGEIKEGEALLRRAVKEAPNDWRIWGLLGKCLDNRATWTVLGRQYFDFHFPDLEAMRSAMFDKKPSAEKIAEWRKLRQEELRCLDRAIELAPQKMEPYCMRAGARWVGGIIEAVLRAEQDQRIPLWNSFLTPAFAADARQIARLSPNDPKAVGGAVIVELGVCMVNCKTKIRKPGGLLTDPLPNPSRDFVHWGMHRLEEMAKSDDKSTAAAASEILGIALMARIDVEAVRMGLDPDASEESETSGHPAEPTEMTFKEGLGTIGWGLKMLSYMGQIKMHSRRAVQLDPARESAWDMLTTLLYAAGQVGEAVALCEQRIKIKDNAHNRFALAYGYAEKRQFDKAAEQLNAGLKGDKNDLDCQLGRVVVLLQREDAGSLKQAGEQIDALAPRFKKAKKNLRTAQYRMLRGLHAALSGDPQRAKKVFQEILRKDADQWPALRALVALGIPAVPGDKALAATYLQTHKAKIHRSDKDANSPVEKIHLSANYMPNEIMYFLSAFPQLRELQLAVPSLSNDGLVHLEHLTALRRLEISCPEITDAGLKHLHTLKRLESVNLHGTSVTEKGIAELRKALPKLDVSR